MINLLIIFFCILLVFTISRIITFAVLEWKLLPINTLSNGRRPHHFVYGNFMVILTSFLVIALGVSSSNIVIVILFGIGLGLILDEFPHWMGNIKELTRNVPIIPGSIVAIVISESLILTLIIMKYLRLF